MSGDRDLTGFGAPPPKKKPPEPARSATPRPAPPKRRTPPPKKRRSEPRGVEAARSDERETLTIEEDQVTSDAVLDLTNTQRSPSSAGRGAQSPVRSAPRPSRPAHPAPEVEVSPPASAPSSEKARSSAQPQKAARRKRINLSLPITLAEALRTYTEEHETYYLDVITQAHAMHKELVSKSRSTAPGALPELRKRRPSGRMQVALGVPPDFLDQLDIEALALDLDRSAYVTLLLRQHLRNV